MTESNTVETVELSIEDVTPDLHQGPNPDDLKAADTAAQTDVEVIESGAGESGAVASGDEPTKSRKVANGELLVEEGDAAGDYLERLLDILDYDGDIDLDVEGERAVVSILGGGDLEKLVGDRGVVLDALQELTRLAASQETGVRSRLMLDIGGFRARRRAELSALGRESAQQVLDSGEPVRLAAMNPFERKIVHDAVSAIDGVGSSSEGEEPRRRVVISASS